MGSGEQNSDPCAYIADTLSTDPSPQTPHFACMFMWVQMCLWVHEYMYAWGRQRTNLTVLSQVLSENLFGWFWRQDLSLAGNLLNELGWLLAAGWANKPQRATCLCFPSTEMIRIAFFFFFGLASGNPGQTPCLHSKHFKTEQPRNLPCPIILSCCQPQAVYFCGLCQISLSFRTMLGS